MYKKHVKLRRKRNAFETRLNVHKPWNVYNSLNSSKRV
jgi:hypothetical protein